MLGIVGESGSGKSVTMLALMGLIAWPGRVRAQHLRFAGHDLLGCPTSERRSLVGKDVAMIFQEPTTSLNPCFTVGFQLDGDAAPAPGPGQARGRRSARSSCSSRSASRPPRRRLGAYPHQLSGGMNQRVMIAMAIACNPRLLIADEPTTALDVTIQAQILDLLRSLQKERGMALVLITHDMGVVAEMAQRVAVMYAGQVVEERGVDRRCSPRRSTPTPRRCSPRCPSARRRAAGWPPSPAWCRACTTGRPAACSRRAAATPPRIRAPCGRRCATGMGGQVRCHYPLGDPQREAADRRATARRRWSLARVQPNVVVVEAHDLHRVYTIRRGLFRAPAQLQAVGGVSFTLERRPHAGGGRRIGLRQVDAGAHGHADREAHRRRAARSTASTR